MSDPCEAARPTGPRIFAHITEAGPGKATSLWVGGLRFRLRRAAQCDSSVGTAMVPKMLRVTPPSTNSRSRE